MSRTIGIEAFHRFILSKSRNAKFMIRQPALCRVGYPTAVGYWVFRLSLMTWLWVLDLCVTYLLIGGVWTESSLTNGKILSSLLSTGYRVADNCRACWNTPVTVEWRRGWWTRLYHRGSTKENRGPDYIPSIYSPHTGCCARHTRHIECLNCRSIKPQNRRYGQEGEG